MKYEGQIYRLFSEDSSYLLQSTIGGHASSYLPVSGTLQKDKQQMPALINEVLEEKLDVSTLRPENLRGL